MPFIPAGSLAADYDVIVIGFGFAPLSFAKNAITPHQDLKLLFLEWGTYKNYADQ